MLAAPTASPALIGTQRVTYNPFWILSKMCWAVCLNACPTFFPVFALVSKYDRSVAKAGRRWRAVPKVAQFRQNPSKANRMQTASLRASQAWTCMVAWKRGRICLGGWVGGWDTKKVTTKRQRIQAVHQHNCLWNTQSAEPRLNLNFHAAKIQQSSQDSLHTASGKGDHERLALPKRPPCICSLWYVRYVEALPACLLKGGGGGTPRRQKIGSEWTTWTMGSKRNLPPCRGLTRKNRSLPGPTPPPTQSRGSPVRAHNA